MLEKSGGERAAVQTLAQLLNGNQPREASGLRWLQHRFSEPVEAISPQRKSVRSSQRGKCVVKARRAMSSPLDSEWRVFSLIVSALTGGLAGAVSAHVFTICRDKKQRKRSFRGYIRSVRAELMALNLKPTGHVFVEWHQSTIKDFRHACCNVAEDISNDEFESAWVSYCGMTESDLAQREGDENRKLLLDETIRAFAPRYELGRDKVVALLDKIVALAK